jgi:hypothetical protein
VPWARAFIAAQLLDARLLPPAFGLNRRAYWQLFGTGADDWIYHRTLQHLLPVVEFTEADYMAHGAGSAEAALRSFIEARGLARRHLFALVTEGLWGGYAHVHSARDFMRSTLYQSRHAARNLLELQHRIDARRVLVGMHVRLGDFNAPSGLDEYRRKANTSLPLDWFQNVAGSLQRAFGDDWQLLLVSDGAQQQVQPLLDRFPCVITADIPCGDCSDVLALADADLLVCSASSYSSLAAFLSDAPYLWFADNLQPMAEGCYSIHGEAGQSQWQQQRTQEAVQYFLQHGTQGHPRGTAVDAGGRIPQAVLDRAEERRSARCWELDLVRGGVTPIPVAG